ncbi:MAG: hypothetical protein UEP78_00830 [Negativibacillus sp.]|nr:hypothetical protein [Negativibacillus sp.]
MNGLKKTLSIMLCVAMIASGSFMAFAEGESNPQNVTVVEGENGGENVGGEEDKEAEDGNTETGTGTEEENKEQSEALLAAAGALNNLPLFDSLTEDTDADALLAQVQAARKAYDALTEEEKLLVEEAKLNNLLDLEFFFENRPSNTPADAPVDQVVATQTETGEEDEVVAKVGDKSYTDLQTAINEANGQTVVLQKNVDVSSEGLKVTGTAALDLNGYDIKAASTEAGRIHVTGNLTLKDTEGQGKIYTETDYTGGPTGYAVVDVYGGTFTMESGSIEAVRPDADNKGQFGVGVNKGSTINIKGGTIKAGWYAISGNGTDLNENNVVNVYGGNLISTVDYAIYHPQAGTLNIEGGLIDGGKGGVSINRGTLNISGGTIQNQGTGDTGNWGDGTGGMAGSAINLAAKYGEVTANITGGTFTSNSPDTDAIVVDSGAAHKYTANISDAEIKGGINLTNSKEGSKLTLNNTSVEGDVTAVANSTVVIENNSNITGTVEGDTTNVTITDSVIGGTTTDTTGVAKIGNETYNTLEEALKAAKSGDTIVLQKDVSTGAVTLPAGVTLDGGNHVITCNTEIANGAFITATGDNVTIKNATVNVDGKAKHGIQFYCVKGGKLENVNVMGGKYTAVIVNGAEVSINGGNLSTNGYAVVEYAMGKNVTEVPKLTMNNVTTPNTKEPLVYMDKDTIDRIKTNTDLDDSANAQQVLEYLKKDNLTGNNIKDMQVGNGGMIIVPAPSTPVAPPVVPEKPNSNSGSTGSSSTVQQMEEREKPDPADKKAMEEYNFWMQVKSKIRATEEGKTLRITVKKGIEYMPASVMQTLYECKVGITLYWDGVTIEIPVGKAQPKQALRVYWTKTKLMDLYNA